MAIPEVGLKAVIKGMAAFEGDARKVSDTFNKLDKQAGKTAKGTNKSLKSMGVGGRVAFNLLTRAIQSGIRAMGQFAISVVTEGSAFQKEMSNVGAVSGAVGAEFDALSDQAKQLGAVTKFTAVEAAEGMGFLAMAGFETTAIIGAMPGVLDLAAASNIDLGKSADIVSNILSGFGATSESTSQFVDVLTKTVTTSNTTISSLGNAFKQVAPTAKNLGLSVSDAAAAIGKLGDAGIQGFKAGTGLRGVLTTLAKTTGKAKDGMDALGVSVFDAAGNMRSLPDIVGQFNAGLQGMSVEQRQAALSTVFNSKQINTMSILLRVGEDSLQSYGNTLKNSVGTASEIAAKQLDNLAGDITLLQSAISSVKIQIFEDMEGSLRGATQATTGLVLETGKAITAWSETIRIVDLLIDATNRLTGTSFKTGDEAVSNLTGNYRLFQEVLGDTIQRGADWAVLLAKLGFGEDELAQAITDSANAAEGQIVGIDALAKSQLAAKTSADNLATSNKELASVTSDTSEADRLLEQQVSGLVPTTDDLEEITDKLNETAIRWLGTAETTGQRLDILGDQHVNSAAKTERKRLADEAASEAERERVRTLTDLSNNLADFVLGQQDAQERAAERSAEFSSRMVDIQSTANNRVKDINSSLSEKLIDIEEKRQEKIHFVLTGAHAKTQEENNKALGFWNEHFDKLVSDTTVKHEEKKQVVLTKQAEQEAGLAAARAKEIEDQKAHIEELKLIAALGALESTGQLEQFTGGLAQSAQDAADLIQAGVIPVTEEMGLALQTTLDGLATTSQLAMEQAGTNADVISQALAGTLVETVEPAIEDIRGRALPELDIAYQTTAEVGKLALDNITLATQNEGVAIDTITNTNLPAMDAAAKTATDNAGKAFTTLAKTGKEGFEKIDKAAEKTVKALDKVEEQVDDLTSAFEAMRDAALEAAKAAQSAKSGGTSGGGGDRQFGGPVFAGVPIDVGERGQEVFVPPSDGFIVPHNLLSRLNVSAPLANQFSVPDISVPIPAPASIAGPALGASTSIVIQNQFTTTIIDQMDEAVFEEKVLRTVERGINA